MDLQHRGLLADANAVIAAAADGHRRILTRRLDELVTHVMRHFNDEEALLEPCERVNVLEHRRAHLRLLESMLTRRQELLHAPEGVIEFAAFITNVVVLDHIASEDRQLFTSFRPLRQSEQRTS